MNFSKLISGKADFIVVNRNQLGDNYQSMITDKALAFGIELTFVGKGLAEKGVIVDVDDSLEGKLNQEGHPIKLGRNIIRFSDD